MIAEPSLIRCSSHMFVPGWRGDPNSAAKQVKSWGRWLICASKNHQQTSSGFFGKTTVTCFPKNDCLFVGCFSRTIFWKRCHSSGSVEAGCAVLLFTKRFIWIEPAMFGAGFPIEMVVLLHSFVPVVGHVRTYQRVF